MTTSSGPAPRLAAYGPPRPPQARAVALVLHGGQEHSRVPGSRWYPAYLRMMPFARDIAAKGAPHGVAVRLLKNRFRGWNAPDLDPVQDARWALDEIRREFGDLPVAIVGHSMGGRVGLRVADDPSVRAVCALAPWTPEGEPVEQLAGREILIAHGDLDRTTYAHDSYDYARRAKEVTDRVARFDVRGERHAMLRRARQWTRLATGFVLGALETQPADPRITNAMRQPAPEGLRVPL
ncbi:alpha/beta fold hydrolase [Actinokineospora auranticolor]|uniref:Alpha/beta hydrolase family protein n=1 Tax=Actinokineospora auranticolor TaxID=155976 RepID=A0A2S6GN71_9PSEU|nr:alpha/beta fold hydrolase [Actinokineospora auranticolor]PPK66684.1 alpha/beta hydrolase family protein [Actinokineospora auranticolor]